MKPIVAYVRVSTGDQHLGPEVQRQKIAAYVALYDLRIVEWCEDALSGKDMERPGLERARDLLRSGQASMLLVMKLDRLTRNVGDLASLLSGAEKEHWALASVEEKLDTATATGRMMTKLIGLFAEWERETIAERTKAALAVKAARGEQTGSVPLGCVVHGDNQIISADPRWRGAWDLADRLRREGAPLRRIALALGDAGFHPARRAGKGNPMVAGGGEWNAEQVRRLLASPWLAPQEVAVAK